MGDLTYATITIVIIWGGIFLYLLTLHRRLRRLEESGVGTPPLEDAGGQDA
jgi:CcmD family protein